VTQGLQELLLGRAPDVAPRLLGAVFVCALPGGTVAVRLTELEAYGGPHDSDLPDPGAHTYRGRTARNASMFGPPAHAYVYRSYGIHWCLNFVCREAGHGAGVLIRAIEPLFGLDAMRARRGVEDQRLLCSGPGKVCQALGVTHAYNGLPLDAPSFVLLAREEEDVVVLAGPRIGISKAMDVPWRFVEAGSKFLSKPMRVA